MPSPGTRPAPSGSRALIATRAPADRRSWGLPAQKRIAKVDTRRHLVLKSAHPSPLSASRGFFGNGHFVKANAWLREKYGDAGPIDWTTLETDEPDAPSAAPLPGAPVASTSKSS